MEMKYKDCFPTSWSAFIFVAYILLYINNGILVTATKGKDEKFHYSTTTVVMFTEISKLLISTIIYLKEHSIIKLFGEVASNVKVLLLYFVPAFLYSLYNNLTFVNLAVFDPTTYYLLLQFRVVVTGIVFQVLFKKKLSSKQWLSLIILTLGCIVKQFHTVPAAHSNSSGSESSEKEHASYPISFNFFLILIQIFCSCFAGVYNEYLLKDSGADVHIMIQNIFMYLNSIVCNFIVLLVNGEGLTAFSVDSVQSVLQPLVLAVIINNAICGITTSLFLKNLNSILKTFASALELIFTAFLCWIIFGIPIDFYTGIAITFVSYAIFLYSQNPVVNKGRGEKCLEEHARDLLSITNKEQQSV